MTNQSRRQFLKTGALFGAASAAAAVSAPAFSTEAPQKWDETTGLLIVGTGFAGCAAALEAHYLGAKKEEIMLVDKMSTPAATPSSTAAPSRPPAPTCRKRKASRIPPTFFLRTS